MGDTNTVAIITFLVLGFFFFVVFIGGAIANRTNNNSQLKITSDGFMTSCATNKCSNELECDGFTFTCRLPIGSPCSDQTDCANGLICSGVCATGATGGLDDLCPCNPGYVCTLIDEVHTVCKGAGGTPCTLFADCASNFCLANGLCATGAPNSFPCTTHNECASNNCSNGFCQNLGIISGTIDSNCAGDCVGFVGATCNSTISQPLSCLCLSGQGVPGVCVNADQGLLTPCGDVVLCSDIYNCLSTTGSSCTTGSCICVAPYNNPNAFVDNCIGGMTVAEGQCYNSNTLGCDIGGQCATSSCGGSAVLASYVFSNLTKTNLGTNFPGATSIDMLPVSNFPGLITPHKMFAVSTNNIDTIYLVDDQQGLYSIIYDTSTFTVLSPWTQLIPHFTQTTVGGLTRQQTLIDVGYNNTTFIVAFNEVVSGTVVGTNDTVYSGPSTSSLTPYNFQPGVGITGTQYTNTGVPLSINYIDISEPNDVSPGNNVLISYNGTIYVKGSAFYTIGTIIGGNNNGDTMTGLTGPARYYFDNTENSTAPGTPTCPESGVNNPISCNSAVNIAFVGPYSINPINYNDILQFSGNVASLIWPTDRFGQVMYEVFDFDIYSITPTGIPQSNSIMLANAFDAFDNTTLIGPVVAVSLGGGIAILPYRISETCRCAASANSFYVISLGSCN